MKIKREVYEAEKASACERAASEGVEAAQLRGVLAEHVEKVVGDRGALPDRQHRQPAACRRHVERIVLDLALVDAEDGERAAGAHRPHAGARHARAGQVELAQRAAPLGQPARARASSSAYW